MKFDPKIRRLSDPGVGILLLFLGVFALITFYYGLHYLAAAEAAVLVILLVRSRKKQQAQPVEEIPEETPEDSPNEPQNETKNE